MAGGFGGDHRNIDIGRRFDEAEMDVEAVGEHQGFALGQVGRNVGGIEVALDVIGYEDHHHVGGLGGFGGRQDSEPGGGCFGAALAVLRESDDDVESGIAEV